MISIHHNTSLVLTVNYHLQLVKLARSHPVTW